jgi:hypothetical protein
VNSSNTETEKGRKRTSHFLWGKGELRRREEEPERAENFLSRMRLKPKCVCIYKNALPNHSLFSSSLCASFFPLSLSLY